MALVEIKTIDEMETALFFGRFEIFKIKIVENQSNDRRNRFIKVYFKDLDEMNEECLEYSVLTKYIEQMRSSEDLYSDLSRVYVTLKDNREFSREDLKSLILSLAK